MGYAGDVVELEGILEVLKKFADEDGITNQNDKTTYLDALSSGNTIDTATDEGRANGRYLIASVYRELVVNDDPVAAIRAAEDLFIGSTKTAYHDVVNGPNISTNPTVLENCKAEMSFVNVCPTCKRRL